VGNAIRHKPTTAEKTRECAFSRAKNASTQETKKYEDLLNNTLKKWTLIKVLHNYIVSMAGVATRWEGRRRKRSAGGAVCHLKGRGGESYEALSSKAEHGGEAGENTGGRGKMRVIGRQ